MLDAIDAFEYGPNIIHVHGDNFHGRGAIDVFVHISAVSRQFAPVERGKASPFVGGSSTSASGPTPALSRCWPRCAGLRA